MFPLKTMTKGDIVFPPQKALGHYDYVTTAQAITKIDKTFPSASQNKKNTKDKYDPIHFGHDAAP